MKYAHAFLILALLAMLSLPALAEENSTEATVVAADEPAVITDVVIETTPVEVEVETDAALETEEGIDPVTGVCTDVREPVCAGGKTYDNACKAEEAGAEVEYGGECDADATKQLEEPAEKKDEHPCYTKFGNDFDEFNRQATTENRVKIGYLQDKVQAAKILAGMDAVIWKAQEYGADSSKLSSLREEFAAKIEDAKAVLSDAEAYKAKTGEMKTTAQRFRESVAATAKLNDKKAEVKAAVQKAQDAKLTELKNDLTEAKAKTLETAGKLFDLRVCLAEEKINRMLNQGFDTSVAEAKLAGFKALRQKQIDALGSGDLKAFRDLRKEGMELWTAARKAYAAKERVRLYRQAEEKFGAAEKKLAELELRGVNATKTAMLRGKLISAKKQLHVAERKLGAGNLGGAAVAFSKVKAGVQDFKEQYQERLSAEMVSAELREKEIDPKQVEDYAAFVKARTMVVRKNVATGKLLVAKGQAKILDARKAQLEKQAEKLNKVVKAAAKARNTLKARIGEAKKAAEANAADRAGNETRAPAPVKIKAEPTPEARERLQTLKTGLGGLVRRPQGGAGQ